MYRSLLALVLILSLLVALPAGARDGQEPHRAFIQQLQRHTPAAAVISAPTQSSISLSKSSAMVTAMAGSISGRVDGIDFASIGSAAVYAWPADSVDFFFERGFAFVDSNFTFRIDSLAAGRYYVMAWAEGFYPRYYDNVAEIEKATPVRVVEGGIAGNINFVMEKITPGTGAISGKVTDQKSGAPIAMATVYVFSSPEPYFYGKTQTDEQGRYSIPELKTGSYTAEVYADGFISEVYDNVLDYMSATPIAVDEPNETADIDFVLSRGGSISGTATFQDGHPAGNVLIELYTNKSDSMANRPGVWVMTYTGFDGSYAFTGLRADSYYLRAEYTIDWYTAFIWYPNAASPDAARPVAVGEEEQVAGINFRINSTTPNGVISGRVVDSAGTPIANASVQAMTPRSFDPAGGKYYYGYGNTDANGYYRISNIPDGQYIVTVWAQNGWQTIQRYWPDAETPENARIITLSPENGSAVLDFTLPLKLGTAAISGFVRRLDGRPLTGAFIQLAPVEAGNSDGAIRSAVWAYAYSDSSGFYAINGLPEGVYTAYSSQWENMGFGQQWFDGVDSASLATPIVLGSGEHRKDIHFKLDIHPIYGDILGTVTDAATGRPLAHAYVEIKRTWCADFSFRSWFRYPDYAITDEAGNYRVEGLPEGIYIVSVHADGGFAFYPDAVVAEQAEPVTIIGGRKTEASFKLKLRNDGAGVLSGRVTVANLYTPDPTTEPATDQAPDIAVIMAKPAITILVWPQSEMFYTTITDREGNYKLTGLPDGEFFVSSVAPGHLLQYFDRAYDPSEAKLVAVKGSEPVTGIDFVLKPLFYRYMDTPGAKEGNNIGAANGVTGQVVDEGRQPLANAVVYLLDEAGAPVSFATTDENGRYQISGLPAGNYMLQAGKPGYATTYNGDVHEMDSATPFSLVNSLMVFDLRVSLQGSTDIEPQPQPTRFELLGNYPNPFNPETAIRFTLPEAGRLALRIFNAMGQQVRTLHDGFASPGYHEFKWNGTDDAGDGVVSGLYFYRLDTAQGARIGKMLYLR